MAVERLVVADRTAFFLRPDYRVLRVLALLGLVVLWESMGPGWNQQEPNVLGEVLSSDSE